MCQPCVTRLTTLFNIKRYVACSLITANFVGFEFVVDSISLVYLGYYLYSIYFYFISLDSFKILGEKSLLILSWGWCMTNLVFPLFYLITFDFILIYHWRRFFFSFNSLNENMFHCSVDQVWICKCFFKTCFWKKILCFINFTLNFVLNDFDIFFQLDP